MRTAAAAQELRCETAQSTTALARLLLPTKQHVHCCTLLSRQPPAIISQSTRALTPRPRSDSPSPKPLVPSPSPIVLSGGLYGPGWAGVLFVEGIAPGAADDGRSQVEVPVEIWT